MFLLSQPVSVLKSAQVLSASSADCVNSPPCSHGGRFKEALYSNCALENYFEHEGVRQTATNTCCIEARNSAINPHPQPLEDRAVEQVPA